MRFFLIDNCMKKGFLGLILVLFGLSATLEVTAQRVRTTAVFDADTSTRPAAGFYGVGVRNGKVYVVKPTGNTERLVAANSHVGTNGQVLYSNGTVNYFKMLSAADIVGFGGGLGTNYLPKWNGSGFVNSLAFDNGTNFSIGTNTGIDSYSRLYVFGGTNGANIDARPGGGGYDQSIVDLQGSDYATNFNSAHLRYQGVGAVGTTLGYSNANLADLTYNYAGSNRAFLIRSVGQSPIVFGVDNAIKGKFNTTGLNLENLTASNLLASDVSKNVVSLSTATYPSLTETSYLKGVTSAVQTQLNAKESALTFSSPLSRSTNTISIPAATTSVSGHLTSTDWNTFNGKFATPSGLTTNYLPKWNGSGFGNSAIYESGGNVGIGTASPSGKLHVAGGNISTTGAGAGTYLGNRSSNGYDFQWYADGASLNLYQHFSGGDLLTINQNGNVGIGTTSLSRKFEIAGAGGTNLFRINATTSGTGSVFQEITNTGGTTYIGADNSIGSGFSAGNYAAIFGSGAANPTSLITSGLPRLTILSGGNVGIGTISPQQKTHINTSLGGVAVGLYLTNDATNATIGRGVGLLFGGTGNTNLAQIEAQTLTASNNTGGLIFKTANAGTLTERLRIDQNGNVGVGTASFDLNGITQKMSIASSGTTGSGIGIYSLQNVAEQYVPIGVQYGPGNINNGSQVRFGIDAGGDTKSMIALATANGVGVAPTEKMRINNLGNVGIGTASPSEKLEVSGVNSQTAQITSTNGDLANLNLKSTGNNTWSLSADAVLRFKKDATEYMRISNSGNVGIGTSSHSEKLEIAGNVRISSSSPMRYDFSKSGAFYNWIESDGVVGNNFMRFAVANTEAVRILQNGNVGVGINSPTRKLEVKNSSGNSQSLTLMNNDFAAGTTGTSMQFATGAATGNTYYKLQVLNSGESGAGNIVLQSDGGNVGVGTVSPTSKLQVVGLPTYADNAAAITGGLTAGAFYRTSTGVLMVVY